MTLFLETLCSNTVASSMTVMFEKCVVNLFGQNAVRHNCGRSFYMNSTQSSVQPTSYSLPSPVWSSFFLPPSSSQTSPRNYFSILSEHSGTFQVVTRMSHPLGKCTQPTVQSHEQHQAPTQ